MIYLNGYYFKSQQIRSESHFSKKSDFFFFKCNSINSSIIVFLFIDSTYTIKQGKLVRGHTFSSFS